MDEELVFSRNDQDDIRNGFVSAFIRKEMHGHKNEVKKVPAYGFKMKFKVVKKVPMSEVADYLLDNLELTDERDLEDHWKQYYDDFDLEMKVYYHEFKLL